MNESYQEQDKSQDEEIAPCIIYTTIDKQKKALDISSTLVDSGLAACVNILDNCQSVYKYKGKMHQDREIVMIIKTDQRVLDDAISLLLEMHPYTTPCTAILPILGMDEKFATWYRDQFDYGPEQESDSVL